MTSAEVIAKTVEALKAGQPMHRRALLRACAPVSDIELGVALDEAQAKGQVIRRVLAGQACYHLPGWQPIAPPIMRRRRAETTAVVLPPPPASVTVVEPPTHKVTITAEEAELNRYKSARDAILRLMQYITDTEGENVLGDALRKAVGCEELVFNTVIRELVESGRVEVVSALKEIYRLYRPAASPAPIAIPTFKQAIEPKAVEELLKTAPAAPPPPAPAPSPQPQAAPAEEPSMSPVTEHEAERVATDQLHDFILSLLRTSGPLTTTEISHAIGRKPADGVALYYVRKLREEGLVSKGKGRQSPWELKATRKRAEAPKAKAKASGKTKAKPKRVPPKYKAPEIPAAPVEPKLKFNARRAEQEAAARAGDCEFAVTSRGSLRIRAVEIEGALRPDETRELFTYLDRVFGTELSSAANTPRS